MYRTLFFYTTCEKLNLGHDFLCEPVRNRALLNTECYFWYKWEKVILSSCGRCARAKRIKKHPLNQALYTSYKKKYGSIRERRGDFNLVWPFRSSANVHTRIKSLSRTSIVFGNYVTFKLSAIAHELASPRHVFSIITAPPRCSSTKLISWAYHKIMWQGQDEEEGCALSLTLRLYSVLATRPFVLLIRNTFSLKTYPCNGRPRGNTQCALSAILKSDKLKCSLLRACHKAAGAAHVASSCGTVLLSRHLIMWRLLTGSRTNLHSHQGTLHGYQLNIVVIDNITRFGCGFSPAGESG